MVSLSDIEKKQVVELTNGKILGKISDVKIDSDGKISALVTTKKKSFFSKDNKKEKYEFLWGDISSCNSDVILVKSENLRFESEKIENLSGFQTYFAVGLLILSVIILIITLF